jgi:pimeloyl-ACP methyl ester carboxylesterase
VRRSTHDASYVLIDGPWQHRFVAAGGSRFHVAEMGDGPLVLLLHGFPQFWWAWRHQLVRLAEAGYRVAAMDLRGYGASDKTPHGYDTITSASDVATVIRSLGEPEATVIGHDWGGWIAWSMPGLQPRVTSAIGSLSMPHPARMREAVLRSRGQRRALRWLGPQQVPFWPERYLTDPAYVARVLGAGAGGMTSAPGYPSAEEVERYSTAMAIPFVAHSAAEYYRWLVRSQPRRDGRRFRAGIEPQIDVPVLQIHGGRDRLVLPETADGCADLVRADYRFELVADAGHFLPEERPVEVGELILEWLDGLDALGRLRR